MDQSIRGYLGNLEQQGELVRFAKEVDPLQNLTAIGFWVGAYKTHAPEVLSGSLAQLFAGWSEGKLKPHVSHVLPLEAAEAGLDLLRNRTATGKVVVTMG